MWRGQIFGTPPEPHFNLPSAALAPELLNEWLSVLAEENANHIVATPKKKVQIHNSSDGSRISLRWGANSPGGGRQHTILPYFPKTLHEIERIWAPLDPPLNRSRSNDVLNFGRWRGPVESGR